MNTRKRTVILCLLLAAVLLLAGCGLRTQKTAAPKESPSEEIIIEQNEPVTTSAAPETSPVVTPQLAETPAPAQTQTDASASSGTGTQPAAETPVPTLPASTAGLPTVTKSPTGETVTPGGSCWFVAKYENAVWAEWHFVSPDGTRDLDYEQAAKEFSGLEILKGYASTMQLKNIPESLNGWSVYCRFSNNAGAVNTGKASITVQGSAAANKTDGRPIVTKNPTGETVAPGGGCSFVAKYKDAIWAEWHFVSPDGSSDLDYVQAANSFKSMTISGGGSSVLKLSGIPASLNGWSVYCRFSNHSGAVKTSKAFITVSGSGTVIGPAGPGTVVPDGPGTVIPDGPGAVVPGSPDTVIPGGSDPTGPIGPWDDTPGGSGTVVPGGPGSDFPGAPDPQNPSGPWDDTPGGPGAGSPGGPGSDSPGGPGVIIYG